MLGLTWRVIAVNFVELNCISNKLSRDCVETERKVASDMKTNAVKLLLLLTLSVLGVSCASQSLYDSEARPESGTGELKSRVFEPGTS